MDASTTTFIKCQEAANVPLQLDKILNLPNTRIVPMLTHENQKPKYKITVYDIYHHYPT